VVTMVDQDGLALCLQRVCRAGADQTALLASSKALGARNMADACEG
jgi:hypothetical protein